MRFAVQALAAILFTWPLALSVQQKSVALARKRRRISNGDMVPVVAWTELKAPAETATACPR